MRLPARYVHLPDERSTELAGRALDPMLARLDDEGSAMAKSFLHSAERGQAEIAGWTAYGPPILCRRGDWSPRQPLPQPATAGSQRLPPPLTQTLQARRGGYHVPFQFHFKRIPDKLYALAYGQLG